MSDNEFDDDDRTAKIRPPAGDLTAGPSPTPPTLAFPADDAPDPTPPRPPSATPPAATPAFRPENESTSPEPGFVGYITAKRGPQVPPEAGVPEPPVPNPPAAPSPPTAPPAPEVPQGHPGIRTSTVIIGLILLVIGLTALAAQLGGITVNPAAAAFAVMLAAGVTLMSAAIRRSQQKA
ncbi:hypothetical protein KIH74_03230 [Kineosporia sp. J2-2]|uniref:Uncharacterized protein n=1 Tax=Kineosporia corallincola TaxID=2835133 RepID=A0ABS5TE83_9ACTN|nr:hypothetical protein [Kineosporia corallincola]MBT0767919.1 hypothetical protein [Kineosporia corallincola]